MYEYFHFICRPKLVQSITLVSSPLFRKNLGNLREFFLMHAHLIFKELFLIIKRMSMYLFEGSNTPENPQALRILSQLVPSLYVTRSFCLKVRGGTNTAKLDTSTGETNSERLRLPREQGSSQPRYTGSHYIDALLAPQVNARKF